jgi:hypothetical protein
MRKLFLILLTAICWSPGNAQKTADTTFLTAAVENTIHIYQQAIAGQAKLFNGSKYLPPTQSLEEHPYFVSDDWVTGDVFYDGEFFENVPLMYDIFNAQLVTEHYSSGQPLQLIADKLHHFDISGHHFEKILNDTVNLSLPETGFYDILYGGPTKVICKRQKMLREQITTNEIETFYDEKDRYYIFRNGIFFHVNSKRAAFKLLSDARQPLKKYLKANHIRLKDDKELALKRMAQFYDENKGK